MSALFCRWQCSSLPTPPARQTCIEKLLFCIFVCDKTKKSSFVVQVLRYNEIFVQTQITSETKKLILICQ